MFPRMLAFVAAFGAALSIASLPVLAASPSPGATHAHGASGLVSLDSPAARLRIDLDRLLAEHAFLTIEQMRSGLVAAPDFAAAATAVEANSTEIVNAIGSIYGDSATAPFGEIWRSHVGYLVDYAVALGKGDDAARSTALKGLAVYRTNLANFLGDANPGVDLTAIRDALDMHTAQLVDFIDAEHAGDHAQGYAIERNAYPHMFEIGDALAKVIASRFPDRYTGLDVAYSGAGSLRVTLDRILAEHAFLAAEVMRAGASGDAAFSAGATAIDANSADLQGVIAAAYGDAAGSAFRELWDDHIEAYVAYIEARRATDAGALSDASRKITTDTAQIAGFLAGANPFLDADVLSTMLQQHADHLTGQVDAFGAGDYDTTYSIVRAAYAHMFDAGEALAQGVATQMPDQFPLRAAAPATDAVSPGHDHGDVEGWTAVLVSGLALFALAVLFVVLRAARAQAMAGPAARPDPSSDR